MRAITDLEDILPDGLFPSEPFQVCGLKLDDEKSPYENFRFKYEFDSRLSLLADRDVGIIDAFNIFNSADAISVPVSLQGQDLANFYTGVVSGPSEFGANRQDIHRQTHRFGVKRSPFIVKSNGPVSRLKFYLVNAAKLELLGKNVEFKMSGNEVSIDQLRNMNDCELGRFQYTHIISISLQHPASDTDELLSIIGSIRCTLNIICGRRVGVGHILGCDDSSNTVLRGYGFWASDAFSKSGVNWYTDISSQSVGSIFDGVDRIRSDEIESKAFWRASSFYRVAEHLDGGREVALVSSCSGLEAISSHVLRQRAGWSKNLLKKSSLSDKLSAMASFIRLNEDPINGCARLEIKSKSMNLNGFETLVLFRNRLVHSDLSFEYDGFDLLEAFNASQWLLEMMLLALAGYSGQYRDRRITTGWSNTISVPYAGLDQPS